MGAVAVAASMVLVTYTAVVGYVAAFPDPADRLGLATSIGSNPGMEALFGQARGLETVAGFTEWRVLLVLSVVGAIWALFASVRVLRGEEDAGRTEIVLAAPLTRTGATRATVAGLALVVALLTGLAAAGLVLVTGSEIRAGGAAFLGLTLGAVPAVMAGSGALLSQLVDTRRRAVGWGAGLLGAWYVIRVIADSSADLRWLRWASPLGSLELAAPLTEPDVWPVLLSYATALLLAAVAVRLVPYRDLGAALFGGRDTAEPRQALLGSALGLAARLALGVAAAWASGMAAFGVVIGLLARTAAEALADSQGSELLGRLGVVESGTLAYVGLMFVLVTAALALAAAAQVAATRDEEGSSRLDNLLVRPVGRVSWISGRLLVSAAVIGVAAASVVLGAWAAGHVGDLGVATGDLVRAGTNAVPSAILVLGVGTLLHGLIPRRAAQLTYAFVAVSFLLEIVGSAVELPSWLLAVSVFHHVQPAPAVAPDWATACAIVALGAALAGVGVLALRRRDIEMA